MEYTSDVSGKSTRNFINIIHNFITLKWSLKSEMQILADLPYSIHKYLNICIKTEVEGSYGKRTVRKIKKIRDILIK
jgi:hypothetical protein